MVMNGLAIILSLFIMAPMMMSTMDIAEKLQISAEPSPKEVIGIVDKLSPPLRKFPFGQYGGRRAPGLHEHGEAYLAQRTA